LEGEPQDDVRRYHVTLTLKGTVRIFSICSDWNVAPILITNCYFHF